MSSDVEPIGPDGGTAEAAAIPTTSVVLPVFNERDNIGDVVKELLAVTDGDSLGSFAPVEIVLVDDGSTDGSRGILGDLAADHDSVRAVFLRRNFGQSAALTAGIDHAQGEFVVTMDSDGQNDPADIPKLLERLTEGYDCVSGWRVDRKDPLGKRLASWIQTHLAVLTGPDIHDFGCTLKAYRSEALEVIELYGEGHRYIPAKLYKQGFDIAEEPVAHRPRSSGNTKYGSPRLLKGFVDLLFQIFWNRYSTRPLHILGGLGFLFLFAGTLIGTHAVVIKYFFGIELVPRLPRLILTGVLVLFGLQLIMFGFLSEIMIRMYYRDGQSYRVEDVRS